MGTDLEAILDNNIGQPMASIFFNSFGQKGTLAVWAIVVLVQSVYIYLFHFNLLTPLAQVHDGL